MQLIGYAGGTFDLFHSGHVNFLRACARRCDHLVVALNTDEFATRYKRKPVMSFSERSSVVTACRFVDEVVVNVGEEDSGKAILLARANIVFHGDDWPRADLVRQLGISEQWLAHHRVTLEFVPYTGSVSTSEIIERVYAQKT